MPEICDLCGNRQCKVCIELVIEETTEYSLEGEGSKETGKSRSDRSGLGGLGGDGRDEIKNGM